jgi:TonB family protein
VKEGDNLAEISNYYRSGLVQAPAPVKMLIDSRTDGISDRKTLPIGGKMIKRAILCSVLAAAALSVAENAPDRCVLFLAVPTYPRLAQAARIEGVVKVKILINEKGEVIEAAALSGHEMLRTATVENVKTWKFAPVPNAKVMDMFMTYLYSIEGAETPMTQQKCAQVKLDLPTRVEITVPPLPVETTMMQ